MMLYVLDTDHLVILERKTKSVYGILVSRLQQEHPANVCVSIVSFHEQMQGWLALLNRARTAAQTVLAYRKLEELGRSFFEMNIF
jgi:tRNA(fMet)-specific endonuclease VapC